MFGQVLHGHGTAHGGGIGDDRVRQRATVERIAPGFGNLLERVRDFGSPDQFPGPGPGPVGGEMGHETVEAAIDLDGVLPGVRRDMTDLKTVPRVVDRGVE